METPTRMRDRGEAMQERRRAKRARRAPVGLLVALCAGCGGEAPTGRGPVFVEVTEESGVHYQGMTFGATWGDYDGDGAPDLYLTCHHDTARLYRNRGAGTFEEVGRTVFGDPTADLAGDKHGAVFADLDNDGDQDLAVSTGANFGVGSQPAKVFLNRDGFEESAAELGLDYPLARGRGLLPVDLDDDGRLDMLALNVPRPDGSAPSAVFVQRTEGDSMRFVDVTETAAVRQGFRLYAQLTHVRGHGAIWLHGHPSHLYARGWTEPELLTQEVGLPVLKKQLRDSAWADFDGDGSLDLFCVRSAERSGFETAESGELEISIISRENERGVHIDVGAENTTVALSVFGRLTANEIFVGAGGHRFAERSFMLDSADANTHGIHEHVAGVDKGLYAGYDPGSKSWEILVSSPSWMLTNAVAELSTESFEARAVGFDPEEPEENDLLLLWDGRGFVDRSREAGIDQVDGGICVAAADFDNDMDVDLYVVRNGPIANLPNYYYENLGNGTFLLRADGAGAPGSSLGRGDAVAVADFDGDGFLDLCVVNGEGKDPFVIDGPVQMYRNLGNPNHWLQIDLVGRASNRDGIGARVSVKSGSVDQVRLQDAGLHRFAQNHKRLHFGLGAHRVADRIEVHWPSGAVQELANVSADQVLVVVESGGRGR